MGLGLTDRQQALFTFISAFCLAVSYLPQSGLDPSQRFLVAVVGVFGFTLKEFLGTAVSTAPQDNVSVTKQVSNTQNKSAGNVVTADNQNFINGQYVAPIGSTFIKGLNSAGNTVYIVTTPQGDTVQTIYNPIKSN